MIKKSLSYFGNTDIVTNEFSRSYQNKKQQYSKETLTTAGAFVAELVYKY